MCQKHNQLLQLVCLVESCGLCYADTLLTEKYRPAKATGPRMKMVPSMSGGYGWVEADPSDPKAM